MKNLWPEKAKEPRSGTADFHAQDARKSTSKPWKICQPQNSGCTLPQVAHGSKLCCIFKFAKTISYLSSLYWNQKAWDAMKFVNECLKSQNFRDSSFGDLTGMERLRRLGGDCDRMLRTSLLVFQENAGFDAVTT